jgi:uncharacterized protein YutE (UPF0331/DUF86 family)
MVDRDLLLRKLALIDEYASQAAEYRGVTVDAYRGDWRTQRIVERTLQLAIEACLDVANHLIADRRLPVASTYAEAFQVLSDQGILEAPVRDAMIGMAGFRNVLVHEYARINPGVVVDILQKQLSDFQRFRDAVLHAVGTVP